MGPNLGNLGQKEAKGIAGLKSVCFYELCPCPMKNSTTIYLSLGSNLGNRLNNLQKAVFRLAEAVGPVRGISGVYSTPSWGFEAPPFLNACLAVETVLPPQEVLGKLLKIESSMGRERSVEAGYQSRNIDVDLLYYGNELISTPELTVPHPQLHQRRFVLKPLADIAPQLYHPRFGKDTRNLLQECKDQGQPIKVSGTLFASREQLFSQLNFMAIEGNIGAGKTTLARRVAETYNAKLVLERFADNPFLPKFYQDPGRYAFPLEMSFLADRYQQFTDDTSQFDLFKSFMVSDYDIYKSLIFAKITLQKEEFGLYRKLFNLMYREVQKPGIYVYLYQDTARLLEQIKSRGREYELDIKPEYLEKINRGYLDFLKGSPQQDSLILDVSPYDFVSREEDFETLMAKIQEHIVKET